jgi:hypothetical protein
MSRNFRLGAFIVFTLLVLAVGVFLIGNKEFMFRRTFPVKAAFQTVAGLNQGADVRLGGIRAGTVQRIDLPASVDDKVTVVMTMQESARPLIHRDSVASIKTAGLLGDEYLDISFGSRDSPQLGDGEEIHSTKPVDVTELTSSVAAQTKATLASVQEDMQALKQNFLLRGYFDKRGYEDSGELTRQAIAQLPSRAPSKAFEYPVDELFDKPDNAKLQHERQLKEAGSYLEQAKYSLAVIAVSSVLGDTQKERALTQAKSAVIRNYLVANFKFDDTRLKTIGLGKTRAAGDTSKVRILIY